MNWQPRPDTIAIRSQFDETCANDRSVESGREEPISSGEWRNNDQDDSSVDFSEKKISSSKKTVANEPRRMKLEWIQWLASCPVPLTIVRLHSGDESTKSTPAKDEQRETISRFCNENLISLSLNPDKWIYIFTRKPCQYCARWTRKKRRIFVFLRESLDRWEHYRMSVANTRFKFQSMSSRWRLLFRPERRAKWSNYLVHHGLRSVFHWWIITGTSVEFEFVEKE